MTRSRNLAVWLHEALDRFPADPLRFYLASNLPETGDVAFSWRDFGIRINSDLIGNLGNYINRVLSFAEKYADGEMTRPAELPGDARAVFEDFKELERRYETRMHDPERARATLYVCSVLLGSIAYHAAPYVPEAIGRLEGFFDGPIARVSDLEELPEGYRVTGAEPLFQRIEDDDVLAAEARLSRAVRGE